MPSLRTKKELATIARAFAVGYKLVEYGAKLYMPIDVETRLPKVKEPERTIWIELTPKKFRGMANAALHVLFATESEERSFKFMVRQWAEQKDTSEGILVRTGLGTLSLLNGAGELVDVTGEFTSNHLDIPYSEGDSLIEECFQTISNWVGGQEQAHSLLYHLATALQTTFSARKYVLLIGEGYNGKGTLLKMINTLFGEDNISGITRQDMAAKSPAIQEVNGKILNVVMDGPKEFLKDSFIEKTLIAGEHVMIRLLFENWTTRVQTNALFIEALNKEPVTSDKSPAVQKRLTRFHFNNVYADDPTFTDYMTSPEMLAAFLQLLIRHWVTKSTLKDKLALTAESLDLQMEAVWELSPVIRFLEYMDTRDENFLKNLRSTQMQVSDFIDAYRPWMVDNGYRNGEDDYIMGQLKNSFKMERKTIRINNRPTSRRCIVGILPDTLNAIATLEKGESVVDHAEVPDGILTEMEE